MTCTIKNVIYVTEGQGCRKYYIGETNNLFDDYFITLQLVIVPCGGGRSLPVLNHSADYISFPLGSLGPL